jgi:SAM-dependent methyltransferase
MAKGIDPSVDKFYFNSPVIWDSLYHNQERFDKEAKLILEIIENSFDKKGISLLDVGCGTGGYFPFFLEKDIECSGIDLNPKMIEYGKKKYPDLNLRVMDMKDMGFDSEFDVIICFNSTFLYNLTNEEILRSLKVFKKALRPEGIIIIDFSEQISYIYQRGKENPKEGCIYDISGPNFHAKVIVKAIFDPINQLTYGIREFIFDDGTKHKEVIKYRKIFAQEFKYFLNSSGFTEIQFRLIEEDRLLTPARLITIGKVK